MNTGKINTRGDLRCSESIVGMVLRLAGYASGDLYIRVMIIIQSFQILDM